MKNTHKQQNDDFSDEKVIAILAEEVLAHALNVQNELKDPFDVYLYQLQAKVFSDLKVFQERCLQGYRHLKGITDSKDRE